MIIISIKIDSLYKYLNILNLIFQIIQLCSIFLSISISKWLKNYITINSHYLSYSNNKLTLLHTQDPNKL